MIEIVKNLDAAVDAARSELARVIDAIVNLQIELRGLTKQEDEHQRLQSQQDQVAHEVRETLRNILSLKGIADALGSFKSGSEDDAARQRRERIEAISAQLELHELQEELLCRALERPGNFMLPRRADADPALIVAPGIEVESALEAALAEAARGAPTATRKSRAA